MTHERARIIVHGAVQGVGFRPFVYRLATELHLTGWVLNSPQGVAIEIEGSKSALDQFLLRLEKEKPRPAIIQSLECTFLTPAGFDNFEIRSSETGGDKTALILPDISVCSECIREIFDPQNRRHLYPFTNCTHCGPRFSIIEALPYDRPNTSMKHFEMCPDCAAEYHNPADRRFHAQPNACPNCGPQLSLWDAAGKVLSQKHDALLQAAEALRAGKILALKGLGGFQLIVDARNENAVQRLRQKKRREEKPFAVMCPSLESACANCLVSELEARLLQSPESPIVLLECQRDRQSEIAPSVAPGNPCLGVMLPYTPLHNILLRELGFPIVATSGNLAGEPICTDEHDALERLHDIADFFLVHNRPIVRHMDDSVARIILGREMILRRARGYAPLPIQLNDDFSDANPPPILAVGAHLKNTVALGIGRQIFLSQHIGDLETKEAFLAFKNAASDLPRLYDVEPEIVACDIHPDYLSTRFARGLLYPAEETQHHYAHTLACMAENHLSAPVLGIAWDGTGYGANDGTIWGGEHLVIRDDSYFRFARFRHFKLPGGDACSKQPRRSAVGLLDEIFGDAVFRKPSLALHKIFSSAELSTLRQMLEKNINVPQTSSVGRLFDAVASLVGLRQRASFEGQAAMELEFAIERGIEDSYEFDVLDEAPHVIDWEPMIQDILAEVESGFPVGVIAAKFHNTLAEIIVRIARMTDLENVALSGGCFQNKYLIEHAVRRLRAEGFQPSWHQRVPTNDGGIALGQIVAAQIAQKNKNLCVSPYLEK